MYVTLSESFDGEYLDNLFVRTEVGHCSPVEQILKYNLLCDKFVGPFLSDVLICSAFKDFLGLGSQKYRNGTFR